MNANIPKYKLVALKPIERTLVMNFWDSFIRQIPTEANLYECNDGSNIVLHNSNDEDLVFVEFQCQLSVTERSVSFGLAEQFLKFCRTYESSIRVLRNKSEIPASFGAMFSDMKNSLAFRKASHLAEHLYNIRNKKLS